MEEVATGGIDERRPAAAVAVVGAAAGVGAGPPCSNMERRDKTNDPVGRLLLEIAVSG